MTSASLFGRMKSALLDLQASNYQTFERPLKVLAKLLRSEELAATNEVLTRNLSVDDFLAEAAKTGGSMVGSAKLPWPDDEVQVLGLTFLLIQRFAENPNDLLDFGHSYITSGNRIDSSLHGVYRQIIFPFVRDYEIHVTQEVKVDIPTQAAPPERIFIVHGRDTGPRESVARFLERIGFQAVILHEQANMGGTIIEKVERQRDVGFAVVLLTPDDEGRLRGNEPLEPRVRQNVLLELGYFMGCLGRSKVCVLKSGDVDIPSDFAGSAWVSMDNGIGWQAELARELRAAGYSIDWNKVM